MPWQDNVVLLDQGAIINILYLSILPIYVDDAVLCISDRVFLWPRCS